MLSIGAGILALLIAAMLSSSIMKAEAGNELMQEISGHIHEGAMAFLYREYKALAVFILVVAIIIGIFLAPMTAVCFIAGAVFSILAGYCGMNVATKANVRTTAAAEHGMPQALQIAFSGGSVMGLGVVGLGITGVALAFALFGENGANMDIVTGFGLGASSIALFARVGGGIYTKAADVGADLVGKVEAGIPEDDPRNPATIADNVGDNVGDVAGMGADLFESYVGAIISVPAGSVRYCFFYYWYSVCPSQQIHQSAGRPEHRYLHRRYPDHWRCCLPVQLPVRQHERLLGYRCRPGCRSAHR